MGALRSCLGDYGATPKRRSAKAAQATRPLLRAADQRPSQRVACWLAASICFLLLVPASATEISAVLGAEMIETGLKVGSAAEFDTEVVTVNGVEAVSYTHLRAHET